MIILAIETSCDDTCVAVLEIKGKKNPCFKILSNIVSSQVKIHARYGGVYPFLAKREHQKNLPIVLKKALKKAGNPKIDLIAVTIGPGLEPCLWVGINFAKELATIWNKPLATINHMEGHIFSAFLKENFEFRISNLEFPAIALLASGGHTQLILMKGFLKYKVLGETRDDAAGECFDKTARILGLGYPGGPIISLLAKKAICEGMSSVNLPRPMIYQKNYDFSFSGLKTAVLYLTKQLTANNKRLTARQKQEICAETQQAIIDVLIHKTLKAARDFKVKTVILGGGVTANKELREQLKFSVKKELPDSRLLLPELKFTGDNAAMIALAAYFHAKKKEFASSRTLLAEGNLRL